jgi:UrcA family protein
LAPIADEQRLANGFFAANSNWHGPCNLLGIGNHAGSDRGNTTMQTIKNRSIAAFGAVLATFATVAAASPARAETRTVTVSYADVDLGSTAGNATVDRRIRAAAARVCGPMDLQFRNQVAACRRAAIAQAKTDLTSVVSSPVQVATR